MRIALAALILETNTFSPQRSDTAYFKANGFYLVGSEIIAYHTGIRNEVGGFLDHCQETGSEVVPLFAGWAVPHGKMPLSTYRTIKKTIIDGLKAELGSLDAVYLALHGSMVADGIDDPEGDLLVAVRKVVGSVPIVASFDFHGNMTEKIVQHTDILVGYNSYPHDNMYETGRKSSVLLHEHTSHAGQLFRAFVKLPMILPLERMTIADNPPMRKLIEHADSLEELGIAVSAAVFGVQPWIDVDELGSCIILTGYRQHIAEIKREILKMAHWFYDARTYFMDFKLYDAANAIREALASSEQPVLLNEPSDNVGSGATGDSPCLIRALLESGATVPTILTICDPAAVSKCLKSGVGTTVTVTVGGAFNPWFKPIEVSGVVRSLSDGTYVFQGPVQHGVATSMGCSAIIEFGIGMFLQITALPPYTIDPEHYRCMGLLPERMKLVGIKSQGSYKASYDGISKRCLFIDSPGLSRSDVWNIPYGKVDRERTYPFMKELEYEPTVKLFPEDIG
jgi:microcystin degradation protein MlrC